MNSRERIAAALRRQSVDCLAIDFGGTGTTGINAYSYMAAKKILGLPETTIRDVYKRQTIPAPTVNLMRRRTKSPRVFWPWA